MITSVGISAENLSDPRAVEIMDSMIEIATKHECIKRVHSLTVDFEEKEISFYAVPNYSVKYKERERDLEAFRKEICDLYSEMNVEMYTTIDM